MQARNDFLDQGRYPKIDLVNRGKINEIRRKGRETNEEKKIANISTLQFVSAKSDKNDKKMQKSSIGKKKSAWIGAGRRRDQERKSSLLYADVKRRNRESQSIPHEKQGIKLAPHDELAIRHSIKKNMKNTVKLHLRP